MGDLLTKKSVSLVKEEAKKVILSKGLGGEESQVVAVVDVSPSMENPNRFYSRGIVDGLVTRVLGLGLNMDDNGEVPVIALDFGARVLPDMMTQNNLEGYVQKHLRLGNGTYYAPSIQRVLDVVDAGGAPALALCFTDGKNFDELQAQQALVEASKYPVFFQWFGIHNEGRELSRSEEEELFPFLSRMDNMQGRTVDNAGFASLSLSTVTDKELYSRMLNEYPQFLQSARGAGLLPWDPSNDPAQRPGAQPSSAPQSRGRRRRLFGR